MVRKYIAELDALAAEAASLPEMVAFGVEDITTREGARQYLIRTGIYDSWKRERSRKREKERSERENARLERRCEGIVGEVYSTLSCLARFLYDYYRAIDDARTQGKRKPGIARLAIEHGMDFRRARRLLKQAGVELFYESRTPRRLTLEERVSISRAFDTVFPMVDICFYLDVPEHSVQYHFRHIEKERGVAQRRVAPWLKHVSHAQNGAVSYRHASKTYEMVDAYRYSPGQIAKKLDKPERLIQYLLDNRPKIELTIRRSFARIFPNMEIAAPYFSHYPPSGYALRNRQPDVIPSRARREASSSAHP